MPWLQLTLTVKRDEVDAVNAQCDLMGALCVTLKDHGDEPLFCAELGDQPLWQATDVVALFEEDHNIDAVINFFKSQEAVAHCTYEKLEDQDWVRASLDSFQPIQFADNFWVCPSWSDVPDPTACNVMLDPGLAFGTGTHETTRLCLQYLAELDLTNKCVIDYGCGSGILGLSALALGAHEVWAIDNDPQAVLASQKNLSLNPGINQNFHVALPADLPSIEADIVVANILAAPLMMLAPTIEKLSRAGGELLLSGILSDQVDDVRAAYEQYYNLQWVRDDSGWILCSFQKKG
jgi:ribosomal protein L11 methyltransferase